MSKGRTIFQLCSQNCGPGRDMVMSKVGGILARLEKQEGYYTYCRSPHVGEKENFETFRWPVDEA